MVFVSCFVPGVFASFLFPTWIYHVELYNGGNSRPCVTGSVYLKVYAVVNCNLIQFPASVLELGYGHYAVQGCSIRVFWFLFRVGPQKRPHLYQRERS